MGTQVPSYEKKLITRIKDEDVHAFKTLFELYYEKLCHFVNIMINDRSTVEEIVQQVFVNIWENRHQLTITGSIKSYLYTACKNQAVNITKRKDNTNLSIHLGAYDEIKAGQNPEEIFAFQELNNDFHSAIDDLPQQAKKVFMLKHFERAKQKDIANMMNISESTVEKHMGYAVRHLRKSLSFHRTNS